MTTFSTVFGQVESLYVGYFGTTIEAGDVVSLVGTVNMTAADYANITANHFSLV